MADADDESCSSTEIPASAARFSASATLRSVAIIPGAIPFTRTRGASCRASVFTSAATPGRSTFDVRMGEVNWPCQKPPWGRLTAIRASTGDVAWQVPLGITEQLPAGRQNTGRPALAGAIVTRSGLVFVGSTDDNRFRALESGSGKELWAVRLERRGNADPITYQGRDGRQYVAIVATEILAVYALPR